MKLQFSKIYIQAKNLILQMIREVSMQQIKFVWKKVTFGQSMVQINQTYYLDILLTLYVSNLCQTLKLIILLGNPCFWLRFGQKQLQKQHQVTNEFRSSSPITT